MRKQSDPRLRFEPELALVAAVPEPARRTWLPMLIPTDQALNRDYWLTRAARGHSWHRTGRAVRREKTQ
jgi:hypothetical protein